MAQQNSSQLSEAERAKLPYGGKLCEGFDEALQTEIGYVVQGAKVWFAYGKESNPGQNLCESLGDAATIVESMDDLELYEDAKGTKHVKEGIWYVEGPAQRSDVINANKRTYPREIWERLIARIDSPVQECIKARGMLGHLEHPKDGRTDGNLGAWLVTESRLLSDGVVWNKYEILDTPAGLILQEYTRKGVRYGSSSRGNGSVDESGIVNKKDFMVETWDAVMRPSTTGAYPTRSKPKKESEGAGDDAGSLSEMTEEAKACVQQVEALVEESNEGLTESEGTTFAAKLLGKMGEVDALAKSGAMPDSIAYDVRGWLQNRLAGHITSPLNKVDTAITEALADTPIKPDKKNAAFGRVIESMQRRIDDSVTGAETLRGELTEALAKLKERDEEISSLRTQLKASLADAEKIQARLDVATESLSEQSARKVEDPVADELEEAIKEVPALAQHRTLLSKATTTQELREALDPLLGNLLKRDPIAPIIQLTEVTNPSTRRSLPRGAVTSEGITSVSKSAPVQISEGANLAARVVAKTVNPTAAATVGR